MTSIHGSGVIRLFGRTLNDIPSFHVHMLDIGSYAVAVSGSRLVQVTETVLDLIIRRSETLKWASNTG